MNSIRFLQTLWQDLRYALRAWRRSPAFAVLAVLSLALGIGANTTIYSVVHAVLLRSLPYPDPSRLVRVEQTRTQGELTMPELELWKQHSASFVSSAGYRGTSDRMLVRGDKVEWIQTMPVTADFFRTLGIMPALGRELHPEETRPRGPLAIVLSNGLWQRLFGGDLPALVPLATLAHNTLTL